METMNRFLILLILIPCKLFSQSAPEHSLLDIVDMPPITIDDFGLKGSVQKIHTKSFQTVGFTESSSGEIFMEFDRFGKMIKDRNILAYQGIKIGEFERTYVYNDKGQIIQMKWQSLDDPTKLPEYTNFTYNNRGQLTSSVYISSEGISTEKEEWIFNASGFITGWQKTKLNEVKPFHVRQFTFDNMNRLTKVIDMMTSNENGTDTLIFTYGYTDGVLLPTAYSVKSLYDTASTYNQLGTEKRTYNASNDHILSVWPSLEGESETISYTYDNNGNWTRMESSFKSSDRQERSITYFTELTPYIYRKTIADALTPSINNFGIFAQAVQKQSMNSTELVTYIEKMQETAMLDVKKMEKLGDLTGNTARNYAIQYLTTLSSSETRLTLKELARNPQNTDQFRALGMTLNTLLGSVSNELAKMK